MPVAEFTRVGIGSLFDAVIYNECSIFFLYPMHYRLYHLPEVYESEVGS